MTTTLSESTLGRSFTMLYISVENKSQFIECGVLTVVDLLPRTSINCIALYRTGSENHRLDWSRGVRLSFADEFTRNTVCLSGAE